MLRRILLIGGSSALGALALAVVQIRVGSLFGAGSELDAFFVGAAIPSVLLAISAGAIANLVVPRLPSGAEALTAARRYAAIAGILSSLVAALIAVAAPLIVRVLAPGLDAATAHTATETLRIYSISIPPTSVAFVFTAYGFASGRLYAAGASTALYGATWTALLFVGPFTESVTGVAWAGVLATGVQLLSAFVLVSAPGARPWPVTRRVRVSRVALAAAGAVLGATIVGRAVLLLDPLFGSLLAEGSVSQLSFATRITLLAVFVSGQGAAFSLLIVTRERSAGSDDEARVGIVAPLLLSIAAAAFFVIAGPGIGQLLLARGQFSPGDAREVGELLRLYAPAVIVMTLIWAMEALLFSAKQGRAVLERALAGLLANLLASAALVALLDRDGRPLGVLVGFSVQLAGLLWVLRDDERVAVLRAPRTLRVAAALLLSATAVTSLVYFVALAVVPDGVAVVLAALVLGAVTLLFVYGYERRELAPPSDDGDAPGSTRVASLAE